ncbi:b4c274c9-5f46-4e71-a015-68ab3e68c10a, partial [Thermothielavioides terrestris]
MPDSALKKRRRPEDETPQSKKKVDFQQQPSIASSFSVTKLRKPQVSPPVVALTPGISLPDSFPFDVYEKDEQPTAKRRKSGLPTPSEMALHSASHRTIDYTARKSAEELWEVEVIQAKKMGSGTVRSKQAPAEAMEVGAGKP